MILKLVTTILIAAVIILGANFYLNSGTVFNLIFIAVATLMAYRVYRQYRRKEISRQRSFIEGYQFPESLTHSLSTKYPHLDESQIKEVLEHLRWFFIRNSEYLYKPPMVSIAAGHAWKVFSETEPEYREFCESAFGKYLPYTPSSWRSLETFLREEEPSLWVSACQKSEIDPLFPDRLPHLFSLDERLEISDGCYYTIEGDSYSHLLDISFAPTPAFIVREIEEKLSTQLSHDEIEKNKLYLTRKIHFYINHNTWLSKHFKSEINDLLNAIENNDELLVSLFGEYALFEEQRRLCNKAASSDRNNPKHLDYDPGCSCGSSGAAR